MNQTDLSNPISEPFEESMVERNHNFCSISFFNFLPFIHEYDTTLLCCYQSEEIPIDELNALKELSYRYGKKLEIGIIRENFLAHFMSHYNIFGTPTLVIFQNQKVIGQLLGKVDADSLLQFITPLLLTDSDSTSKH